MAHDDNPRSKPEQRLASIIGPTKYTDELSVQGALMFRFYTHGVPDDKRHASGCPGCDPQASDNPELEPWFRIEAKHRAAGDPPSCPKMRQEWYREQHQNKAWWREERDGKAHYDPDYNPS